MLSRVALLQRFRRLEKADTTEKTKIPRLSRKRDLFIAFVVVSLPLLVISVLLLAFIFLSTREKPAHYVEIPELPFFYLPPSDAFYTKVSPGSFLLVGSWASNIAEIVVAPFMILFSYAVARESLQQSLEDAEDPAVTPSLLREIMRGTHVGIWRWIGQRTRKSEHVHGAAPLLQVVDVAGLGLFTATLLTLMVILGDNWLHATTQPVRITHYADPTSNRTEISYASFLLVDNCNQTISAALPQNISDAPVPCSLNTTDGLANVAYPNDAYLTLGTGISQLTSSFNGLNFSSLAKAEIEGTGTPYQVVTHVDHAQLAHSLLFYMDAAAEYDLTDYDDAGPNYGIDYVANTTSMVTQCTFATEECSIHSTNTSNNTHISVPFDCYDDFSGDLGQTPSTGHERAQGWNMSFHEPIDGTPRNIPVQAQNNPFHFYVASAVNSIDIEDFKAQSNLPEGSPGNDSLVDGGRGFTAFALSCEATIYDVTFSLINGSFWDFNTTKSSPQKASIIKAPLQVGFGQYHLYQAASLAVLATNDSVAATMAKAISQTGMALASGVFDLDSSIKQRYRWTVSATKVPKAPFYYLVTVCLVYSVFGMVMTVVALHLRRIPEVREQQARLMLEWGPELLEVDRSHHGEKKTHDGRRARKDHNDQGENGQVKEKRREESSSRRTSTDLTDTFI